MKNGIRPAQKQDIPALCEIWKSCFSDSEEYIKLFYRENFERMEVLVYAHNFRPVSAVHIMDAELADKNTSCSWKYLYAGGTLPEYRKEGFFTKLMEYSFERAKQTGHGLFLKPATPALTGYFTALGFKIDSYFRLVTVNPTQNLPAVVSDISYSRYNRMRNEAFSGSAFVRWNNAHVRWCVKENAFFSGRTLGITLNRKEYFLMGYPDEKTLVINETNLSLAQIQQMSGSLCRLFGTERIEAYMPDSSCNEGERIVSCVVYNAPVCNAYVNLILI